MWQGAPEAGLRAFWGVLALSIFGVPFLLAGIFTFAEGIEAFFYQKGVWSIGLALFYASFSIPFLLAGLAMTCGVWLAALYGHRYIQYALSDKRAYIARSFLNHTIDSYVIGKDDVVTLVQGRFDTVWFATVVSRDNDGDKITRPVGFDWIRDGHAVYQLIRQIQKDAP